MAERLIALGADVGAIDPHIDRSRMDPRIRMRDLTAAELAAADAVVALNRPRCLRLGAAYTAYQNKADTVATELAKFYGDSTIPAIAAIKSTLTSQLPESAMPPLLRRRLDRWRTGWTITRKNGATRPQAKPTRPRPRGAVAEGQQALQPGRRLAHQLERGPHIREARRARLVDDVEIGLVQPACCQVRLRLRQHVAAAAHLRVVLERRHRPPPARQRHPGDVQRVQPQLEAMSMSVTFEPGPVDVRMAVGGVADARRGHFLSLHRYWRSISR